MALKFTKLLKEAEDKERAEELARLLNSDEWYNRKPLLYRGTSHGTETWSIKDRRKSRKPIDTDKDIHMLVDVVGSSFYSDMPGRNSSRFASTDSRVASKYGDVYLVFPHQSAKVGGIYADSLFEFFQPADLALTKVREEVESVKNSLGDGETLESKFSEYVDDWVIKLLNLLYRIRGKNKSGFSKVGTILNQFNDLQNFFKKLDDISKNLLGDPNLKYTVKNFKQFATSILQTSDLFYQFHLYFDDLEGGFSDSDDEVLIEGRLIQANTEFMKKHFLLPSEDSVSKVQIKNNI